MLPMVAGAGSSLRAVAAVGSSPVSFDKQFLRDYLETTPWDKNSPPPPLPEEIIEKTRAKYEEIRQRIFTAQ